MDADHQAHDRNGVAEDYHDSRSRQGGMNLGPLADHRRDRGGGSRPVRVWGALEGERKERDLFHLVKGIRGLRTHLFGDPR